MKTKLMLLIALLSAGAVYGKEWRDTRGRSFRGVLVWADGSDAMFEKYGHGMFTAPRGASSSEDRRYISQWLSALPSATILKVRVIQLTDKGALVSGAEWRRTAEVQEVSKWYSKLDRRSVSEQRLVEGWREVPLPSSVFIAGLDDAPEGTAITWLVVWSDGFKDYTTVGNAKRRVESYTIVPPAPAANAKPTP